ncbi:hypothetical protein F4561_003383 [Lipingzhangella halophila]|uniref:ARB-07466-like C-terminal domain-containing protein n=1 Tax=Lipingzhangella halophila TaxID=1783352 RepID=A0A7W7W3I9_9ACTN|nr:hypothetical protein [Lipingzhangella halophila]MBB4932563.1 hypothetical protein [Lipingzhangella halophila]
MEPHQRTGEEDFADFWAPDPDRFRLRDSLSELFHARPVSRRGRAAAVAVVLAASLTVPLSASQAASAAPSKDEPEESLDELTERSEELSEDYNGELRDMEAVLADAEKAEERAQETKDEVEAATEQVRQLAVASYTNGGVDPSFSLFVDNDPQQVLDQASLVEHLSSANQDKVELLEDAIERDEKAQENAEEKAAKVEEDLDELEGQREKVQSLIADYPEQEMGGPDNLTPRTRQMREVIIEEFGEHKDLGGVGCFRESGGAVVGEHPKGRACDFMVAKYTMPSKEQTERGQRIADWAKDNADRLGIMYIIWRQQIWDIRRGDEGWRDMEDRGSITENHFDHVHISMF